MIFHKTAASSALNTTGVLQVSVQRPSLDLVWNTFAILMLVYYVGIYLFVCVCMSL